MTADGSALLKVPIPYLVGNRPVTEWSASDQSLFNRITVAVQSLDLAQLHRLLEEVDPHATGGRVTDRGDWTPCMKIAIRNVEAYIEMVEAPESDNATRK